MYASPASQNCPIMYLLLSGERSSGPQGVFAFLWSQKWSDNILTSTTTLHTTCTPSAHQLPQKQGNFTADAAVFAAFGSIHVFSLKFCLLDRMCRKSLFGIIRQPRG
jgi:hypothetical protein